MPATDPIDRLVGEIDKLVDEELARGPCDDDVAQADCPLCGGDWHGAPAHADTAGEHGRIPDCPGAFASDAHREQWTASGVTAFDLDDLEELCERCGCLTDPPPRRPVCSIPEGLW
jgi:hypothetical protein